MLKTEVNDLLNKETRCGSSGLDPYGLYMEIKILNTSSKGNLKSEEEPD